MNEAKQHFTELALTKAARYGHSKYLYWDNGEYQYFVEAFKDGRVVYSLMGGTMPEYRIQRHNTDV